MKTALSIAFVMLAACGGNEPKPEAAPPAMAMAGSEHDNMPPEMTKFHDLLAPHWHADKGAQRMTDTCGVIGEFQADAGALAGSAAPAGADATMWSGKTAELTEAVVALDGTCKASDLTTFEAAFERVHNGFHAVMEVSGGHHEEHHEGMGEGGMHHADGEHGEHHDHDEHGEHGDHKM